jgi:hypothetical protein
VSEFWRALAFTLAVEFVVALGWRAAFRLPWRLLAFVPLASLLSLPLVWFVFPLLPLPDTWVIALSELFAFSFEAVFLYLAANWRATRSGRLPAAHAVALSLAMNAASFLLGLLW